MANIVAALGVPHTPAFPSVVPVGDRANETARLFADVAEHLRQARADTIVMFDSDHLNTFFLDNWPIFAIGAAPYAHGPNDGTPGLDPVTLTVPAELGRGVHEVAVGSGFDIALTQEFTVDHSILVPLHFLRTEAAVLPVFVNGLVPPLPLAARCAALGRTVAAAVRAAPGDRRVALVASGSFSLDVGGPHLDQGRIFGVPDPGWAARVLGYLAQGDLDGLIAAATPSQLAAAGNVGGELLNWIAVAAAAGGRPGMLEAQEQFGHAYAWWNLADGSDQHGER
jgi:protocatechuate 4,5-dioxygenase beta chain